MDNSPGKKDYTPRTMNNSNKPSTSSTKITQGSSIPSKSTELWKNLETVAKDPSSSASSKVSRSKISQSTSKSLWR